MRSISELRQAEEKASNSSSEQVERAKWAKQKQDDDKDDEERRMRSEILRRQRNNEAQSLIKQRSIDARAIFEQNTSAGQLSVSRRSSSSNMSSPSPTPSAPNKVAAKWPPSPTSVSPSPVSPSPASPTPVVHPTSVPTNFYSSNHSKEPVSSVSSPPKAQSEWMLETPAPAVIVPAVPELFADAPPQLPSSPPPIEQPQQTYSTSEAMLNNGNQQDYEDVNEYDDKEWESDQPQELPREMEPNNLTESEIESFGIRARALYDYQAGN